MGIDGHRLVRKSLFQVYRDRALNGIFEPMKIVDSYYTFDNFYTFLLSRNKDLNFERVTSDLIAEFSKETGEKLGIHPFYVLWLLREDLISILRDPLEYKDENFFQDEEIDLIEILEGVRQTMKKVPKAFKKLSKIYQPFYIA